MSTPPCHVILINFLCGPVSLETKLFDTKLYFTSWGWERKKKFIEKLKRKEKISKSQQGMLEKTIQQEIVLLGKHDISIKLLNKEFSIKSQSSWDLNAQIYSHAHTITFLIMHYALETEHQTDTENTLMQKILKS